MLPRAAADVLSEIAILLELRGQSVADAQQYAQAARAVQSIDLPDLASILNSAALARVSEKGQESAEQQLHSLARAEAEEVSRVA